MSNYEKLWKESEKSGAAKNVMPVFFKFENKGDHCVGKVLDMVSSKSRFNEGNSTRYTIQTDKGLVEFNLTPASDKKAALVVEVSGVYAFVLKDLVDTGKKSPLKDFAIYEVIPPDGSVTKSVRSEQDGDTNDTE